ncbi:hypothetical protein ACWEQL_32335 [Kitasatospora sp. NPDC004240]
MFTVRARYRWRTSLRTALPLRLMWMAPKGGKDCGSHDWYRHDEVTFRCYHCAVGVVVTDGSFPEDGRPDSLPA